MSKKKKLFQLTRASKWFLIVLIILSFLGLLFVFEASTVESFKLFGHQYYFVKQQAMWLALSFLVLFLTYFLKMEFLEKLAFPLYLLALLLLALPLIPGVGMKLNGANRWISTPWFSVQPVEFFKFAFINFYASFIAKEIKLGTFIVFLFLPALILLLQPDFGSLMIIVSVSIVLYFLGGGDLKFLAIFASSALALALIVILSSPYRRERLTTFLNPELDPAGDSYHIHQITLALGSGSWMGRGIGNSQQKYAYVPEASSDSIFAIIAEEIGFIGSVLVIVLLGAYFATANASFAKKNKDHYQFLLFYGILAWIAVQIFFNLAAVVVLLPLSGMPLPFFSQGGSSLLSLFFASGILLNIANQHD